MKKGNFYFFFLLVIYLLSTGPVCLAQHEDPKEYLEGIKKAKEKPGEESDTLLMYHTYRLARHYLATDPDKSYYYGSENLKTGERLLKGPHTYTNTIKRSLSKSYNILAAIRIDNGLIDSTSMLLDRALELAHEVGFKNGLCVIYNNYGNFFVNHGNYKEAINQYSQSLKIAESLKDHETAASCLANIAVVYDNMKNYQKALEFHNRSITARTAIGDSAGLAQTYNNMGATYTNLNDYDKALNYFLKSFELKKKLNLTPDLAQAMNNIGHVYAKLKQFPKAGEYFNSALALNIKLHDDNGKALVLFNLGGLNKEAGNNEKALEYYKQSLELAEQTEEKDLIKDAAFELSELYELKNDPKKSLAYYKIFSVLKDSLLNAENIEASTRWEMQYGFDKQEEQRKIAQTRKDALAQAEQNKQKIIRNSLLGGSILLLLLVFFIVRSNRIKQKANEQLTASNIEIIQQKEEILTQKIIIEDKNKEINDSINYARRIQKAVMPEIKLTEYIQDSFLYYRPKDIVSGDFFWYNRKEEKIIIAVADCTGHGIPGAFMSMIGSILVDNIFSEKNISAPGKALAELNVMVKNSLKQHLEKSSTRDGMDIAIVVWDQSLNKLVYSGANRPLWLVRDHELHEIKATKAAIGGLTPRDQAFEEHIVELHNGDTFYLFTDGFADQFGGEKEKKLTTSKFKNLLLSFESVPLTEQKNKLDEFMKTWKGKQEQIDDFLIIGIKV